jgi:hypothetical protein
MDHETSKGILKMLFDELLEELSPESLAKIAKSLSEKIREGEMIKESHVRKLLNIQGLEFNSEVAQNRGFFGLALKLQNQAESIRFSL